MKKPKRKVNYKIRSNVKRAMGVRKETCWFLFYKLFLAESL